MYKMKRILCLLAALVLLGTTLAGSVPAYAQDLTNESIREKENQISQAQKEKNELKNSVSDIKSFKKELEKQKNNLKNYVAMLDQKLTEVENHIEELTMQIGEKEEELENARESLILAKEQEAEQKDAMLTCIKILYEQKDSYITELLTESVGLGDMLNKASYMEKIADYNKQQWKLLTEYRELIEVSEREMQVQVEYLDEARLTVEAEQANLEELIAEKETDISAYESDIAAQEKAIKDYEDEIAAQDEVIKQLEKAIEEEKKQLLEASRLKYDGGVFAFPLAKYTRISSDFGMRLHPIFKVNKMHNGVDFASPKGTDIYAAYDGKVVAATYHYSMGNYVMIDHGDSLYTIYMHASKLCVKDGETVIKGQKIAEVGTTGNSSGYHLHFGVRLNGVYVSPWNYLSN